MPATLFILPSAPLNARSRRPRTSSRRPAIFACAAPTNNNQPADTPSPSPSPSPGLPGDPEWMKLAQDIAPNASEQSVERPPPKWTFPEGDLADDAAAGNAWQAWNTAQQKEEEREMKPRDPQAETDFWRTAARDVQSTVEGAQAQAQAQSYDVAKTSPSVSKQSPFNVSSAGSADAVAPPPISEQSPFNVNYAGSGAESSFAQSDTPSFGEQNGWSGWNSAAQKGNQGNFVSRSPQAETDIWRTAARDMQSAINAQTADETGSSEGAFSDAADNSANNKDDEPLLDTSADVWGMARGVTGEMTTLQDRLRDELEQYNPDENKDQYRGIARELVGPENDEPWDDDKPPVRVGDDLDAGSGWNPDLDWMRYDDVGREKALAADAAKRRAIENAARETMESALDEEDDDADGKEENAWGTLTDQRPSDFSTTGSSASGQVPGFIANRMREGGTYGDGWKGSKREIENLKEQGVELRDAKSDTESWRAAARELDIVIDAADVADLPVEDASKGTGDAVEKSALEAPEADGESGSTEGGNPWSTWQSGNSKWEQANERMKERDPKAEVDMWRDSARELSSASTNETAAPPSTAAAAEAAATADFSEDAEASETTSVWEQWRQANVDWERSVEANETEWAAGKGEGASGNKWAKQEDGKVDWGAGMGKTNSERSAWDSWNRVSGPGKGDDGNMWWRTRLDGFGNADGGRNGASSIPDRASDRVSGDLDERLEKDSSVNSWRSLAKELTGEEPQE